MIRARFKKNAPVRVVVMDTLLRKYLWALDGLAVVVIAWLGAHATATMVEATLLPRLPPISAASHSVPRAPAAATKRVDQILERNIFCSTCPPLVAPPAATLAAPAPSGPVRTALPFKLMAIMFAPAPADPRWSTAVIRATDSQLVGSYRRGDEIQGAAIVDIEPTRVYLQHEGRAEFLDLFEATPTNAGAEPQRIAVLTPSESGGGSPSPPARLAPAARGGDAPVTRLFGIRGDRTRSRTP